MHRYNQRGWRGSGLEGQTLPLHPCGQLTRCFSAVAELLVINVAKNLIKRQNTFSLNGKEQKT